MCMMAGCSSIQLFFYVTNMNVTVLLFQLPELWKAAHPFQ